ncbi:MAG TPA: FliA/WhiG family RNA polymerase sigma factor [Solirubrobacteraceae bacterium]|nr:FliA/WhiG family RNA polymerase sigma factor [Solirubrobacteraceae bacterium]
MTTTSRRTQTDATLALWREYKATGDVRLRNRLVMTYAPLVKYIVYKKVRQLPTECEVDDFISCGLEALITSIDRFDPARGVTLDQFAWTRIHGAVLDELRRRDWAPRSLRRWERDILRARERFTVAEGRGPTTAELAAALGISVEDLRVRQDDIARAEVGSLNALVHGEDHTTIERIDTLPDEDERRDPAVAATLRQAKDRFRRAFDGLPRREREVAVMLYVNNLTLREIGDVLGVSESRVCQIHGELKRTLKHRLADDANLLASVG